MWYDMDPSRSDTQSPTSHVGVPADSSRPRIAKACSTCSRQKLRCDGAQPCTRCVSLGSGDQCLYLPSMRGKIKRRKVKPLDSSTSTRKSGSPILGMNTAENLKQDPNRQVWERSKELHDGAGARNSALWDSNRAGSSGRYDDQQAGIHKSPVVVPLGRRSSESTLDKLTTTLPLPGDAHNPLSVLVEMSETQAESGMPSSSYQGAASHRQKEEDVYYAPLERTLKEEAPHIMALINTHEAKQLFDTFFTHMHPHLPMLDREQSSPGAVARRNNFLFNAICCCAARSHNVVIWERLKDFARFEMERLPKEKNIDVVQGHLIYTWWNLIRPTRFEQDMTWLRAGIACRTAIDIALHRVGSLATAREGLPPVILKSIIRTWILCFVIDRTLSVQLGKPNGRQWESEASKYVEVLRGPLGHEGGQVQPTDDDVFVASLGEWALITSQAVDSFRFQALQTASSVDSQGHSPNISLTYALQLQNWRTTWLAEWRKRHSRTLHPASSCIESQFEVYEQYALLVIQSLALQHAQDRSPLALPSTFAEYRQCALRLIQTIDQRKQTVKDVRSLPDFAHNALTYAATSLLRCTQARFVHLQPDRQEIFTSARKAAELLAEAAIGPDHIAAVQSALVSKLVTARDVQQPISNFTPNGTLSMSGIESGPVAGISPNAGLSRPLVAADFELFGRALNVDQNMTPWPPFPLPPIDSNFLTDGNTNQGRFGDPPTNNTLHTDGAFMMHSESSDGGLAAWVTQQDLNMSGNGLGPGVDEFLLSEFANTDTSGLFNESLWQSLLSNGSVP